MKHAFLAAAAALALTVPAGIAIAQDTTMAADAHGDMYMITDAQKGMYTTWPADRQTMFDGWPDTYKTYYWTLTPEQQDGWWVLNADQRARVYAMTPPQRTAAWAAIAAQMSSGDSGATMASNTEMSSDTAMSAAPVASATMQFVSKETVQPVAASADAAALQSGDLPVCKPNQQDGCINSWEKNKTGTRPLDHWPGKPASEMPGK